MNNVNQMRYSMAIHMLQRSNPATRPSQDARHGFSRRHLGRLEPGADRRVAAASRPS